MAPVGAVQCPRCRQATTPKDPAAREWTCPVCFKVFRFLRCEVCPAYGPIGAVLPGGQRVPCVACGQPVRVPRLAGDKRWGTAANMAADIELRGMPFPRAEPTVGSLQAVDPDYRRVAVCTVIGGYGLTVPFKAVGTLSCDSHGLSFTSPPNPDWAIAYDRVVDMEIGGPGVTKTGGGFIGAGFGLSGALEGMLVASVLNALTTKTRVNSLIGITTASSAVVLHTSSAAPADLRVHLLPVLGRLTARRLATPTAPTPAASDPLDRLERLARLHEAGVLSEPEFIKARAVVIAELTQGMG